MTYFGETSVVMSEWQVFSATQVQVDVLVNVLHEWAFWALGDWEGQDSAGFLIGIDIWGSEKSLVPLAGGVGAAILSLGEDWCFCESSCYALRKVIFPHEFTLEYFQHILLIIIKAF